MMEFVFPVFSCLAAGLFAYNILESVGKKQESLARPVHKNPLERYPLLKPLVRLVAPLIRQIFGKSLQTTDEKLILGGRPWGGLSAVEALSIAFWVMVFYTPVITFAFALVMGLGGIVFGFAFGLIMPFFMTFYLISEKVKKRAKRLDQQFPYFLDFLVMMREAGIDNLPNALKLYVDSAKGTELGDAMRTVSNGINRHKEGLVGAIMDFHNTCPSETGKSTLRSLVKASEMGARSTMMLRDVAEDMRAKRYEDAEKTAEQIKSNSMIPAVVMFAGAFLMILSGSLAKLFFI